MIRSESRLERILHNGVFAVTAEVVPPRSADGAAVTDQARALVGYADAVNVTDNPTGAVHMSPLAGAALVARAGLEPVVQLTTRDRKRLGLTSDLLGAWALGARNVLCLTGDPTSLGDHPTAQPVYDIDVLDLIRLVAGLRSEGRSLAGQVLDPAHMSGPVTGRRVRVRRGCLTVRHRSPIKNAAGVTAAAHWRGRPAGIVHQVGRRWAARPHR